MKFSKNKFKNGIRLITVPVKGNPTVTVMVFIETGSNDENIKTNGLSHFLEHMFFKGTTNRTLGQITEELDGMGAISNAFTSDECTAYWAKAHYKHLPQVLDVISDMYLNATLPAEEIEKERGVIIEEINMYQDLPSRMVWEVLFKLMYKDQPAGRPTIGPKENIKAFKRSDFIKYRQKQYTADKTVIVVAGKIDEKEVEKEVSNIFKDVKPSKGSTRKKVTHNQKNPEISIFPKKTDQTHFVLGFHALEASDPKQSVLNVLGAILGGGMSSRLFKKMRDELGMCYYVRAENEAMTDHGIFAISSGVNNSRFEEAVGAVTEILKNLKNEKVSAKELKKAKDYLLGSTALSLESSNAWAQFYAFQELLLGKMETLADIQNQIKKVTAEDVQKMAQEIFKSQKANLAVVGDVGKSRKSALKQIEINLS